MAGKTAAILSDQIVSPRTGTKKTPALSLILCSRNDEYMGNSRWRLQTTLNYVADQVEALGRADDIEILVADWGSEIPLRDVIRLTPSAARIVSFLLIPPEIARTLQKDSPFPEVLALNTAARRASGEYIGRIDQDTLVGRHFLEMFFELHDGKRQLDAKLETALLFSNVRMVPYRFAVRCPPAGIVNQFIARFGKRLKVEITARKPFYHHGVGIWLMSKALWHESGGYDEDMLYMNGMETKLIQRLLKKYALIDLGKMTGYDFYHLEHYHPWVPRLSSVYRKTNVSWTENQLRLNPNGEGWGLATVPLELEPGIATSEPAEKRPGEIAFATLVTATGLQVLIDKACLPFLLLVRTGSLWGRRTKKVHATLRGEHPAKWLPILLALWSNRRTNL